MFQTCGKGVSAGPGSEDFFSAAWCDLFCTCTRVLTGTQRFSAAVGPLILSQVYYWKILSWRLFCQHKKRVVMLPEAIEALTILLSERRVSCCCGWWQCMFSCYWQVWWAIFWLLYKMWLQRQNLNVSFWRSHSVHLSFATAFLFESNCYEIWAELWFWSCSFNWTSQWINHGFLIYLLGQRMVE